MTAEERALIQRLFSELFAFSTTAGHRAMTNPRERLGHCGYRGCSASCIAYRRVMDDATDYLASHPAPTKEEALC